MLCSGNKVEKIGKITTSGTITEYGKLSASAYGIAAGPDGDLWVAVPGTAIARVTTSGTITEYATSVGLKAGIALGPDDNMWFTGPQEIGNITP